MHARLGSAQQQEAMDGDLGEGQQTVLGKPAQLPLEPRELQAASAAGGQLEEGDSAGSPPYSSQLAYADAGANAMFTPVPLVDRLPAAGCRLRLEQLPCPSPLPASCPATPAGQRGQPAPEETTPVLFCRPASAGVHSVR